VVICSPIDSLEAISEGIRISAADGPVPNMSVSGRYDREATAQTHDRHF